MTSARPLWLEAIWRYPVKSAAGERLDAVPLGPLGIPGDRSAYVVDARGEIISARTRPALLGLQGGTDAHDAPTVNGAPADSVEALAAVRRAAGEEARLVRANAFERFDILPLLVATDGAVRHADLDVRRLRPNLVIGGVEGLAERTWENRFLRIGDAVIGLADLRDRCIVTTYEPDTLEQDVGVLLDIRRRFGGALALNAWTARAGRVRVGDAVELLDSFDAAQAPGLGRFVA
jgi:MOSC domain-containing protein